MGNAAFHSSALYSHLLPCIAPLLGCLADVDPKTRANAAGALGNLARNSSDLATELASCGVPAALVNLASEILSPGQTHDRRAPADSTNGATAAVGSAGACADPDILERPATARGALNETTSSAASSGGVSTVADGGTADAAAHLRPSRNALFALGNLAALGPCQEAMAKLPLRTALQPFATHPDGLLRQYAVRVLGKLPGKP